MRQECLAKHCARVRAQFLYLFFVFLLQVVLGYCIFVIESVNAESQFRTIGNGVYWAIVTMTTVGYGDYVNRPRTIARLVGVTLG